MVHTQKRGLRFPCGRASVVRFQTVLEGRVMNITRFSSLKDSCGRAVMPERPAHGCHLRAGVLLRSQAPTFSRSRKQKSHPSKTWVTFDVIKRLSQERVRRLAPAYPSGLETVAKTCCDNGRFFSTSQCGCVQIKLPGQSTSVQGRTLGQAVGAEQAETLCLQTGGVRLGANVAG